MAVELADDESSDTSSYSEEEEEEQQGKKAATVVTSSAPTRPVARRPGQAITAPSPSSESSSDSEEESDEEDEDSEDDDDEPEPVKSQPATPVASQRASQPKAASSAPVPAKPLNSKPMDSKTVKPSEAVTQAKPKRTADSSKEEENRKKKKKKKEDEGEDLAAEAEAKKEDKSDGSKTPQDQKKLFQRVWDAGDEINLLRALCDYTKAGASSNDLNGFFAFSRKELEKFKKTQLVDKVRKLKKKYENVVSKESTTGKATQFKTPHEMEAFSLSQSIWGEKGKDAVSAEASAHKSPKKDGGTAAKKSQNNDGEKPMNNRTKVSARKPEEPDSSVSKEENHVRFFENMEIGIGRTKEDELGGTLVNMVEVVDKWIKLAESSKVKDLQERQRKLEGRMLEIHSEHLEIASARAKLALEAFKASRAGRSRQ
ncbi:unnamed protein product [Victoria cruziana]